MFRENLNEIKYLGVKLKKTNQLKNNNRKNWHQTWHEIQWKEMPKDGIKEKEINQENYWKKK